MARRLTLVSQGALREVANETSDLSGKRRIIGIVDLRYQWATTVSRIHRNKLYKFLTKDCKDALQKINDEEVKPELSHELSSFIGKYGTHVVLECTHGYRMEKVERMKVTSDKKLQDFKADIMASVLGYAGIHAGHQRQQLKAGERTENSLGIKNIGSKKHMKEAIEGNGINFEKMMQYSSEGGDAGVISHDWNMMIAEMLLAENSPYMTAAKRLQYWTHVRINDLKAGWDEGLFATSYELKFTHKDKQTKKKTKKMNDKSICVTIGGRTVVHQHPGNDTESCGHVTNVHSNEAKRVQISVLDNELELKEVLAKITVYRRRRVLWSKGFPNLPNLSNDENKCVGGLVMATEIDTSGFENPEGEWELSDLKKYYKWDKQEEKKDEQVTQKEATGKKTLVKNFVTIGKARVLFVVSYVSVINVKQLLASGCLAHSYHIA